MCNSCFLLELIIVDILYRISMLNKMQSGRYFKKTIEIYFLPFFSDPLADDSIDDPRGRKNNLFA